MKNFSTVSFLSSIALLLIVALSAEAQDASGEYPVGIPTDKPGILISPFPPGRKLDVTGLKPGSLAMDPSVEKIFRIPASTPETKSNVGKKTSNYEDYTGKSKPAPNTVKSEPTPSTPDPEPDRPATAPPNMLTKPSITNIPTVPTSGKRLERPRNPGLGNDSGIRIQPKIGSQTDNPAQSNIDTTSSGLPADLEKFVYSFNEDTSNNSPTATLHYFDKEVLYFGKSNQDHNDIARDRAAYIRKYPYRKYRITAKPTVLSAKNGIYELVSPVSYTVQGMGSPISGKVADYLLVKKTPESYLIIGIDETKAGKSRPKSLQRAAQKFQAEARPVPASDPPAVAAAPDAPVVFTGDPEEQVEQLVAAFVKSGELNDPAACLQYVDQEIALYYDLKHPNRNALLKDRSDYIKQWPKRTYVITSEPEVKEIGDRIYEAVFEISYRVRNNSRTVGGRERSVMQVAETEQGLKIISIFSK